jgi:OOP family OmpA-OmpF porin
MGAGLPSSISDDDSDTAFKLFGGYQYNKNLAVEAGYFNLGQFGYTATTVPPATAGTLSGNIKLQGLNLDAVGMLPLDERFSVFGRLGLHYAQAKDTFSSTGVVAAPADPNPSKNALNYKAGLGLQYDFTESLGLRLEAERYRIDDAINNKGDIDMYSLGLIYRFGEKKQAPVEKAATPAPVVAAAPIVILVPVIVKTEQYCSVLDLLFEIKGDEIQRDDKEKLAAVGTFMKKYPDTTAVIEGHSDDVGKSDYNLKLSQQRAESVVSYLVDEHHIAASRLTAVGYGETRPIADNSTKEGKQMNRRINAVIACATDFADLKVKPVRATVAMEMEFDPYKSEIDPKYREGLRAVANFMNANPSVTATVEGHADKYLGEGSNRIKVDPELAKKVSQRRAQNVVNYLADNFGVSRSRLSAEGYGQSRRIAYGTTLEGQQENRRVNIIFNYKAR